MKTQTEIGTNTRLHVGLKIIPYGEKNDLMRYLISIVFFVCFGHVSAQEISYRDEMRSFVSEISAYAKERNSNFYIVPQNGIELIAVDGDLNQPLHMNYINAIDGHAQESLFFSHQFMSRLSQKRRSDYLIPYYSKLKSLEKLILITDYSSNPVKQSESAQKNAALGFVSYAASNKRLSKIQELNFTNSNTPIESLLDVSNFLYLINPENFENKEDYIEGLAQTSYDLFVIDLFFREEQLNAQDLRKLKRKPDGSPRIVLSYMSIGEAEDYRFYWNEDWYYNTPNWLMEENPSWKGNYVVQYWNEHWKNIIFGSTNAYLDLIIQSGFDGVYLDIIDAFEYYEK